MMFETGVMTRIMHRSDVRRRLAVIMHHQHQLATCGVVDCSNDKRPFSVQRIDKATVNWWRSQCMPWRLLTTIDLFRSNRRRWIMMQYKSVTLKVDPMYDIGYRICVRCVKWLCERRERKREADEEREWLKKDGVWSCHVVCVTIMWKCVQSFVWSLSCMLFRFSWVISRHASQHYRIEAPKSDTVIWAESGLLHAYAHGLEMHLDHACMQHA